MKIQKIYKWILFLFFAQIAQNATAQQEAMYTQYMFNGLVLNPAYAGSHEAISLTALHRMQWTGIDGAPTTSTFSIHSPLHNQKIALGATFTNDKIGITRNQSVALSYAYRIRVGEQGMLSMGLQASFSYYKIEYFKLNIKDPDNVFSNDFVTNIAPNFGTGVFYTSPKLYVGVSAPRLLNNKIKKDKVVSLKEIQHYFVTAGYMFEVSPDLKIKPNILMKAVSDAPIQFDFNTNVLLKEFLWLGLSYHSLDSFSALVEIQASPSFRFGYAYNFTTTKAIRKATTGTHEIMLNYRLKFAKDKILSPRYF
jgi:type IX secretion system PorP/SprF family membrane protein